MRKGRLRVAGLAILDGRAQFVELFLDELAQWNDLLPMLRIVTGRSPRWSSVAGS